MSVAIERDVDAGSLAWPGRDEATHDSGLGCNRQYMDLRGLSWTDAKRVYDLEHELIARIEGADDPDEDPTQEELIEEELYDRDEHLFGLDIGVASTVVALSAARCVPFSSCNGGVLGAQHYETHPLVAFYARQWMVSLLLSFATEVDIGLVSHPDGCLVAYSTDIRKMRSFAKTLIDNSRAFSAARPRRRRNLSERRAEVEQLGLLLDERGSPGAE